MVYTYGSHPFSFFPCFPKEMVYTIAGSGDRPREEGSDGGGVYSLLASHISLSPTTSKIRAHFIHMLFDLMSLCA